MSSSFVLPEVSFKFGQIYLRPRTVELMRCCMRTFLRRTPVRQLPELDLPTLREFLYQGRERYRWSYGHTMNHIKSMTKFLDWCVNRGLLPSNPARALARPRKPQALPRRLSMEQAQRLLYASFNHPWRYGLEAYRNHALIGTLLYTGLRAAELLALEQVDLDLQENLLLVRAGKGGKDRYVPVHHKLHYILRRYLKERRAAGKQHSRLFTTALQDRPLGYKGLMRICQTLAKATGIAFTPHCLRHTFGSIAIEQRMGLTQLKQVMGHANIQSTMIYLSLSPQGLRQSMNQVELF